MSNFDPEKPRLLLTVKATELSKEKDPVTSNFFFAPIAVGVLTWDRIEGPEARYGYFYLAGVAEDGTAVPSWLNLEQLKSFEGKRVYVMLEASSTADSLIEVVVVGTGLLVIDQNAAGDTSISLKSQPTHLVWIKTWQLEKMNNKTVALVIKG